MTPGEVRPSPTARDDDFDRYNDATYGSAARKPPCLSTFVAGSLALLFLNLATPSWRNRP